MKNTIIWDMDGTILNTLDDLTDSVNYILAKYNYPVFSTEEMKPKLGNGVKYMLAQSFPEGENTPNFAQILAEFKTYYSAHSNIKTAPYQGIVEVMASLHHQGYKQAIISNKIDNAVKDLSAVYYPLVDLALGEIEGLNRKPAPDMVLYALNKLNSASEDAVYVGDSEVDFATAKNSNLDCICVDWGFRTHQALKNLGAKNIISSPYDLLTVLQKL